MEKLEKHIKERLEERKIIPSPKAWDKIASQVAVDEKPKQKGWYVYAIAASLIGILLFSAVFFMSEQPKTSIQVVEEKKSKGMETQQKIDDFNSQNVGQEKLVSTKTDAKLSIEEKPETIKSDALPVQIEVVEETTKQSLQDGFLEEPDNLIAQKVNEIVTQVELLEAQKSEVTDMEIDSLLRAAQRQILSEQLFAKEGPVDAMALLTEVEDELEGSFRDQIFDALKDGYFAVANRNN
ncbi:hypothetical protein [Flagellimonas eckloniae]|uniref:Uncharacterized protein n=1 Tax=Flagellimonas eckloniae TaxID=346185 RepID=A0A0Q0WWL4_9FLAO|nr:hypothetical protein [Allomuricauda eckloniae]KQC29850.1 hypothetical protein AAY42_08110 [Allomuricauda eckloniae]